VVQEMYFFLGINLVSSIILPYHSDNVLLYKQLTCQWMIN